MSAALAAIAFSVSISVRAETDRVAADSDGLRTWYLATGSVERAIQWMLWGGSARNPDGTARFWEPGQSRMYFSFPSGEAVVELIPEAAKMNINSASPDDLLRVVTAVTGDPLRSSEIVQGIVDWRSPAAAPTAFDQFYFSLSPTFRARHASFQEIEELLLVRGMTPEFFYGTFVSGADGRKYASGGLRDCLSVWGSSGPFDANTASPALMEAIGVPASGVDQIVERRKRKPFANMGELAALRIPASRLALGGNYIWTLRATARLRPGPNAPDPTIRSAAAVVKIMDERVFNPPVHVLRWYDDAWSQSAIAPFDGMRGTSGNK